MKHIVFHMIHEEGTFLLESMGNAFPASKLGV